MMGCFSTTRALRVRTRRKRQQAGRSVVTGSVNRVSLREKSGEQGHGEGVDIPGDAGPSVVVLGVLVLQFLQLVANLQ